MNQKVFVNIILVVVIILLVGAAWYFAFVKKLEPVAQRSTPTPTQTTIPTKTPISPTTTQQTSPTITNNIPPQPNVKNRIVFNGALVSIGETFEFNDVKLKLISINDDSLVIIEYPDWFWSRTPDDPGGCKEIKGKIYRGTFKEGSFLATKTCDGYTVYSFKFSKDVDGTIVINTQSKEIDLGI